MDQLKNEWNYQLSDFQPREDDLAFAKGCASGLLMAAPIWLIIIMIIKFILSR